jgi:hypothetical protein
MCGNVVNFPRKRRRRSLAAFWGFYLLFTAAVGTVVIASWLIDLVKDSLS